MKHHFENGGEPLRMMVLGTAGTGKSYLVYALSRLLGGFLRRAAPTGMAGFFIAGSTLHSLLRLPVRQGKNLQGQSLKAQSSLAGVKYIIIDELSTVSQAQIPGHDDGDSTEGFINSCPLSQPSIDPRKLGLADHG